MMKYQNLFLFFILIGNAQIVFGYSYDTRTSSDTTPLTVDSAFEILKKSEYIYPKYWDDERQIESFVFLLNSDCAIEIFRKLVSESKNTEGQFLGLIGLWECDKELYKKCFAEIKPSQVFYFDTSSVVLPFYLDYLTILLEGDFFDLLYQEKPD
ncbi:MAG: hypothetical protein Ta2B_18200 [Termitinemataceae bacterium]|nr:MAG: hypothetical protein Ta2B_18200 [Termitinemataceae bacterium]